MYFVNVFLSISSVFLKSIIVQTNNGYNLFTTGRMGYFIVNYYIFKTFNYNELYHKIKKTITDPRGITIHMLFSPYNRH